MLQLKKQEAVMKNIQIPKQKTIALVAHDNRKDELLRWLDQNIDAFKGHKLVGTGTTSSLIRERYSTEISSFLSGPMGGDQQLGAAIAQNEIDLLFFFWDPLEAQPHDPDVKALLRIAVLYDIPVAQSVSGANFLIHSDYWNNEFTKYIVDPKESLEDRVEEYSKKL